MPATKPPLIHIGFHKTGTSWLQNTLFCDAERGFTTNCGEPRHHLVERFVRPDPLAFDAELVARYYAPYHRAAQDDGLTMTLSHERFSGYPSSGGFDRTIIAQRMHEVFPGARILMIIREQQSLIRSMYSQHITDGGVESLARFLRKPEPALNRKPCFDPVFYEFDRLIAYYHRLFTRDNILVLPFEMLNHDPQAFADKIAGFCGNPTKIIGVVERVNERRPATMQFVQRPLNALFYHNELSPGAIFHVKRFHKRYARLAPLFRTISPSFIERRTDRKIRAHIAAEIGDHYAHSNARTQEITGLDLARFGYPVGQ